VLTLLRDLRVIITQNPGATRVRISLTDGWLLRLWYDSKRVRFVRWPDGGLTATTRRLPPGGKLFFDGVEVIEDPCLWPGQFQVD
jgi:hypothetical protein